MDCLQGHIPFNVTGCVSFNGRGFEKAPGEGFAGGGENGRENYSCFRSTVDRSHSSWILGTSEIRRLV